MAAIIAPQGSALVVPSKSVAFAGPSNLHPQRYVLAEMNTALCLLQPLSPTAADVRVYTHEFAGIFRFSHDTIIELGQLAVLEKVDPRSTMPDDEQGVIFVAREIMARVAQKTMPIQLRKRMSQRSAQRRRVRG